MRIESGKWKVENGGVMLHSILLLASFAVGVPELPRSAYVDTEASTNFPIAVEDDGKHCMEDWNGGFASGHWCCFCS